ncbi:hypothetical protein LTR08_006534 [Meristemomyces frigidus]|nr:hypothetical protein LTR08_006534 [Meristemomyces frigidus]
MALGPVYGRERHEHHDEDHEQHDMQDAGHKLDPQDQEPPATIVRDFAYMTAHLSPLDISAANSTRNKLQTSPRCSIKAAGQWLKKVGTRKHLANDVAKTSAKKGSGVWSTLKMGRADAGQ